MVHSKEQLPKLSHHPIYIGINEQNFHTFQPFSLRKMRGSTSHCTNRQKLDFVLAPAKQFSLSALPGQCKNLIALGVPKGKFVKAHCHRLISQSKSEPCLNLNLNQVNSTVQLSSFCSDRGGPREKIVSQERVQSPTCDSWCSGWSSNASFRARMVGKCGSFVRLFLCRSGDGTIWAVVPLSGP